uniref:Ribonuclease H-like domain, reverse transcriptase, RNA-dependent DNA polymerase n=1 Tax=Tanacetum cinerariifolium TaxID=118510 RepID=A0A699H362_TANCI|nr:ribonuclease H-like domain, reverse transcriptase, RNA-dependent DNA polymerase [Tanacetum cinerariifolium]
MIKTFLNMITNNNTSGGVQFLGGDKLVSWSSKKQDCTSMSSAKAERTEAVVAGRGGQRRSRLKEDDGGRNWNHGNKAHLADYQEFKGDSVAFRGSNEMITGKGKIKAGRQHNMYNFNLKNIDPSGDLACLFAKASIDESNKWHKRLGIKREYSNARTPQRNGVAERKNWTLIEAARTMLSDSFLPTTFWADAANTFCYVLNKSLRSLKEKEANVTAKKETTYENQDANTNNTNLLNAVSIPISTAGPSRALNDDETSYLDDPSLPHLEDIYASLSEGIFTNSSYNDEAVQTRSKVNKNSDAHASLEDESWVDAMQEELLQLQIQKDKRGVVVRNKARLVSQGHRQEERIDCDEVFAHVARIEAIKIFLAFASYIGFIFYQIDGKSAFMYGTIDKEVYVTQPFGFVDPKFPNKVYKVVKALYGLHQALRAWYATLSTFLEKSGYRRGAINKTLFIKQDKKGIMLVQVYDKYVAEILKKFDFPNVKTASTPIETQKPLVKDEEAADVDISGYSKDFTPSSCEENLLTIVATSTAEAEYVAAAHCDVIRQALHLDDADGVECLPNEEIFTELACMGYEKPPPKLTAKRTVWNEFSCSMTSAIICLATGRKFNFSKYIFDSMVRNVDSPNKFLMYPPFLQVIINAQVDDFSSHTNQYTSPTLTQKVFANMHRVGKGFYGVETPLFATMLVQPQPPAAEEEDEVALEQDKITQALEIFKLKKRVKKLEKKRRSKSSGLKRLRKVERRIEAIDADEDITLVEAETQVDLGAKLQGRKDDDNVAIKEVNVAEPTVFDDEEVTMTMAQTLIKTKAEIARLLDEQMAKRLHDEEVEQAAAKEKQEKNYLEKDKKYQSLKRKLTSIAQARKNMIIYLKNMDGYKMEHFRGMTYDKVRPIFEREYNKVQTLFKPDKDEKPTKKRVDEDTLLQESFKKLKVVEVLGSESTQDTSTNDPKEMSEEDVKNMLKIVPVTEFKVEALQVKEELSLVKWSHDSDAECKVKFGYILQVIKKLELKKLDGLLGKNDSTAEELKKLLYVVNAIRVIVNAVSDS